MQHVFHIPNLYNDILLDTFHYGCFEKGWSNSNCRHFFYEFIYCAKGSIVQWINGATYSLQRGDFLIIKQGLQHHTPPLGEETELFVFHFDLTNQQVRSIFQMIEDPVVRSGQLQAVSLEKWVDQFMKEYKELFLQAGEKDTVTKTRLTSSVALLRMQSKVLDLIGQIAEYFLQECNWNHLSIATPAQIEIAHNAAYQFELQALDGVRIHDLASQLGVSRSYLCECFKLIYGISPKEYLSKTLMRHAKNELQNSTLSIEKIAEKLHYSSAAHFSKAFRSNEGITPSHYRNLTRSNFINFSEI
ncbi:AraC family transcriptional regulator [Paenibacillus taichungensis]|uniref:AraC family transcriptional regulator n=1 Tax=Paenibacillus taichungensis TaxID=484184 RepID=UPI0039A657A9